MKRTLLIVSLLVFAASLGVVVWVNSGSRTEHGYTDCSGKFIRVEEFSAAEALPSGPGVYNGICIRNDQTIRQTTDRYPSSPLLTQIFGGIVVVSGITYLVLLRSHVRRSRTAQQ